MLSHRRRQLVCNVHGITSSLSCFDPDELPRTRFGLLRQRVEQERTTCKERPYADPVGSSWDGVVGCTDGCSEKDLAVLTRWIIRDAERCVVVNGETNWPAVISYPELGRKLHEADPVTFH